MRNQAEVCCGDKSCKIQDHIKQVEEHFWKESVGLSNVFPCSSDQIRPVTTRTIDLQVTDFQRVSLRFMKMDIKNFAPSSCFLKPRSLQVSP